MIDTGDTVNAASPDSSVTGVPATSGTVAHGAAYVEDRAPLGFKVRVFIYLVGVHFIAGFLYLLFYLGGAK